MAPYYDGLAAFLFRQLFWAIPDPPPARLDGQRVLVTGGNSGVGYSLTSMLVSRGAEVVMAVRSLAKGEEARDSITHDFPGAQISVRNCDLSSFESMRSFISQLHCDRLTFDIVVFNAGVWCAEWIATADGLDMTLQVCRCLP
jgi:NAD(P)-dependent dehydrogenase (short-subunit alcohol dehydrogenase family)